jgi:hypothetical protein
MAESSERHSRDSTEQGDAEQVLLDALQKTLGVSLRRGAMVALPGGGRVRVCVDGALSYLGTSPEEIADVQKRMGRVWR